MYRCILATCIAYNWRGKLRRIRLESTNVLCIWNTGIPQCGLFRQDIIYIVILKSEYMQF